jgi:hypothetical protein
MQDESLKLLRQGRADICRRYLYKTLSGEADLSGLSLFAKKDAMMHRDTTTIRGTRSQLG